MRAATGAVLRGLVAATVGTLAMDLLWYSRYKRQGGEQSFVDWELAVGLDDWDKAPAPAKVGKLLYEAIFQRELEARYAMLTTNVMHWGYGVSWGGPYGIAAARYRRMPWVLLGLVFGAFVWGTSYVILPLLGVYLPIWQYDLRTLWEDLSAHLTYGSAAALAFRLLGATRLR